MLAIKEEAGGGLEVALSGSSNGGPGVIAGEETPMEDPLGPDVKPEQCKIHPAGEAKEVDSDSKQGAPLRWVVKAEGNGSATVLSANELSLLPLRPSFSGKDERERENKETTPDAQVDNAQHRHAERNTGERIGAGMRDQAGKNALRHSTLSQLDEKKVQGCAECEKIYCANTRESRIVSTVDKLYQCLGCGKQFSSYGCAVSHKLGHRREKPYPCRACGQSFRLKDELLAHQGTHPGENPYKCCECGKGFSRSTELIRHELHHRCEKFYKCLECGKHFRSAGLFNAHRKLYQCLGCGNFSSYCCVVSHKFGYRGEKLYTCRECDQSFRLKDELLAHQGTHPGENPYKCCECGKGFPSSTELFRHEIYHGCEKFYKCLECGKDFRSADLLNAHGNTVRVQPHCPTASPFIPYVLLESSYYLLSLVPKLS